MCLYSLIDVYIMTKLLKKQIQIYSENIFNEKFKFVDARFASNLNIETYIINFILQQNKNYGRRVTKGCP